MSEWVPFGTVVKPHGIRGEIKVFCESDEPSLLKRLTKLRIASHKPPTVHALKRFKFAGGLVILALEGVDDRNAAEALRNAELEALGTELPPLQNDEYWLYELRGAEAQNAAGEVLGEVVRVVSNSMQLLLELKTPRGIELVPFVDAFIVEFRRDANILVLEPPEGLLT